MDAASILKGILCPSLEVAPTVTRSDSATHCLSSRLGFYRKLGLFAALLLCSAYPAATQTVCYNVFVDPASSLSVVNIGQTFTLTAVVTRDSSGPRTPFEGGTVTFLDNGSAIPGSTVPVDSDGKASFVTSFNVSGTHLITAVSSKRICN